MARAQETAPGPTPPYCHLEFIIIQEPRSAVNSTEESKKGGRDSEGQRLNIHRVIDLETRRAVAVGEDHVIGCFSLGFLRFPDP